VVAWGPKRLRGRIEASGARFRSYDPFEMCPPDFGKFAAAVAEGTEQTVEALAEEVLAAQIDLVVHDPHALWGHVAADFLGLPRVASNPLFPAPAASGSAPGVITGWAARLRKEGLEHMQRRVRALEDRWGVEMDWWLDTLTAAGHVTACTTTSLIAGHDDLPRGWHYVGPLLDERPAAKPAGGRPLVYVALGTVFSYRAEAYAPAIAALADEPVDVLLAIPMAEIRESLGPLPRNVSVHGYVDSREVLARATAHVTHAGSSSVHESLMAGVPMACMPLGSDQAWWAARVEALGAGVVAADAEAIRSAVQRLLEDEGPTTRARELSEHLAGYDGAERLDRMIAELLAAESCG
jgi:MGT family glycosyltransferase